MFNDKKLISNDMRNAAITAAYQAKPRVYQLQGLTARNGKLRLIAFGCQGSANDAQAAVGKAISQFIATHPNQRPDFILLLGDNIYPSGAKSPRSARFIKSFLTPYEALIRQHNIKFFVIPGNHDYDMRRQAQFYPTSKEGKDRMLSQVAYSYLGRVGLYADGIANLDDLPAWNMPALYYALDAGDTRIICLDSNTYLADYLTKEHPDQTTDNNQALWLEAITAEAKTTHRQCILAMHHPTYSPGRRAFKNDVDVYLKLKERNELYHRFPDFDQARTPYNMYLKASLEAQGLHYDLILNAHDHNQYYYHDGNIKQLTLGGGGSRLQPQAAFQHPERLGCFRDEYGYGVIKTRLKNPEKITFSIHALNQFPLFFSNQSVAIKQKKLNPEKTSRVMDENIKRVIAAAEDALHAYFAFLERLQKNHGPLFLLKNVSHRYDEVKCAHEVSALIHSRELHDYQTLLEALYRITKKTEPLLGSEAKHAFTRLLDEELSRQFEQKTTLRILVEVAAEPKEKNAFKLKQL